MPFMKTAAMGGGIGIVLEDETEEGDVAVDGEAELLLARALWRAGRCWRLCVVEGVRRGWSLRRG